MSKGIVKKAHLSISAGTVFAYGIVTPVFSKTDGRVVRFDTDQWGVG